jgi:hypothetical protein
MFDWLEFSSAKDATYCLPCYIFSKKSTSQFGAHCSDPNIYLSIGGIVKGLIWTLGH